jgi:hypothetical protein
MLWMPPDVAGEGNLTQFMVLSASYRRAVWTVLLVCERHAAACVGEGWHDGGEAVLPYGVVHVEIWMLMFGFCRRNVSVQREA